LSKTRVECLSPHGRLTDSLVRRSSQLVVGGQERKGHEACKGEDYDEIRRSAAAAFSEGETKWRIRKGLGGSIPYVGTSVQPPPHVLAAVRAQLIGDRELVRKVAMGVLQAALRKHMEGGNRRPPPQRRQ
jgi:hypothetical protein